ncbi:ATP-binding cassette domain-containing protein [Evansella cellulosilytica]|uniref:ABC transporter related protein n=1 Tax=Evansella cellulosilytica (strain ATCC 21833 / DSM 2522 / FERM P-1141 / JCM 9156 / N-4) TaxID=649639 RepID=E6U222_EVAC2|nr:ABC transporter ATP-binding protein [Evansella cellulosilytica]ADU29266.1 ABC transporter related protein [Evansella cellulosilytica DSM 2522]
MTYHLKVDALTYAHGKKEAIKDVSFQLEAGKVYGLWGRNGAGKTTLMRCMTGLLAVNQGSVTLNGKSPYENRDVLNDICFIQENHPLNSLWKVKEVLEIAAIFYKNWDSTIAEKCLESFNLSKNLKVKAMSKGMRTALSLTIGLSSGAPVMIFDEPTNGLDAAIREVFYELLMEECSKEEKIVIISTHYIQELQRYIEELIVLDEGKLLLQDSLDAIKERTGYIHGDKASASQFMDSRGIIEKTVMGPMVRLMVENEELAGHFDEKVDLQDYLLRKTDKKAEKEVVN